MHRAPPSRRSRALVIAAALGTWLALCPSPASASALAGGAPAAAPAVAEATAPQAAPMAAEGATPQAEPVAAEAPAPQTVPVVAGEAASVVVPPEARLPVIAVLDFEAGAAPLSEHALTLGRLVATRLDSNARCRVVGPEQIRAAFGAEREHALRRCGDRTCFAQLAETLGVEYVVRGRFDRFGRRYILAAVVSEVASATAAARLREEVRGEEELPEAADRVADRALESLPRIASFPVPAGTDSAPPKAPENAFHLNAKLGHIVNALEGFSFDAFTLKFEIEADYYLRQYLLAYLEAGLIVGHVRNGDEDEGSFSLVPVAAGLKYVFRSDQAMRPYVGLGLGLGILGALVEPTDRKLGLHFNGLVGVAWFPWRHVGFNLEMSVNFEDLKVTGGSNLLFGFNSNFGVLVAF